MNLNLSFYCNVFRHLVSADLIVFRQNFKNKLIDLSIWVVLTLVVMGYVMPIIGLSADYGTFQFASLVASVGIFEVFPEVMNLISDFEGDRIISYQLTLPVPSWVIFLKKITYYAISIVVMAVCMLPVGKLVLWNQFDLFKIAIVPLFLIILVSSVFYGAFTLWIASFVPNLSRVDMVWMRIVFPLWFLGGFQFSWYVLYKFSPAFAYINLLNPIVYVVEGTRAAMLGQQGCLPFWVSFVVLLVFTIFFAWHGIRRLQRRIDCI